MIYEHISHSQAPGDHSQALHTTADTDGVDLSKLLARWASPSNELVLGKNCCLNTVWLFVLTSIEISVFVMRLKLILWQLFL